MTILALNLHCALFEMKCTPYHVFNNKTCLQYSSSMYLLRETGINEHKGKSVENLISGHALLFMY